MQPAAAAAAAVDVAAIVTVTSVRIITQAGDVGRHTTSLEGDDVVRRTTKRNRPH